MLAAFTYRDFRVQWFGACTSSIGTWMQIVAQNWLVLSLTGSAFFLGLDAFLQQLPIILFTLIGGVLADRLDRRRTLLMSQYLQMATSGTLAVLMFFHVVQIWHILALSFMTGIAQSFGGPGVPVAHPVARRQEGSAERGRAQLDPVQRRARHRAAALRRDARRLRHVGLQRAAGDERLLRAQRAVVPRRDLRADVAAREAHPAGRAAADARRAAERPQLRRATTTAWWRSSSSRRRRRSSGSRC